MGMLKKRIEQLIPSGLQLKECNQKSSLIANFGDIQTKDFSGYCLAVTGKWLSNPKFVEDHILDVRFQRDTMDMQREYEKAKEHGADFLGRKFPNLAHLVKKEVQPLTAENLYNEIIYLGGQQLASGYIMIALGDSTDYGHALGVIINNGNYCFFDVNECFCSMGNVQAFWNFIYYYVTQEEYGLLKQGYNCFQVALYNHQP